MPMEPEERLTDEVQDKLTADITKIKTDKTMRCDELDSEEAETTELTGCKKQNMPMWMRITIVAVAAVIILFAFIWEMFYSGGSSESSENAPLRARNAIQGEVDKLDWVTPAFLPINEYSRPGTIISEINAIVMHYIGNPGTTAEQNRNYFANLDITGERYASSNFIVGLDGEILQCVPVDEIAYASGDRNADTLSIELCHLDDTGRFTYETYVSAVRLAAWLCKEYTLTSNDLLRHYDVSGKECPKYFVQNEAAWEAFKADVADAMVKN